MFNLDLKEYFLNRCAGMQTPAAPFLLSMPNFSYYLIYFFSPLHSCNGFSFRSVPSCTLPLFSELQKSTVLKATTWTSRSVSREEQRLLFWGLRFWGLSHDLLHPDLVTMLISAMLLQVEGFATTISAATTIHP